MGLDPSYFYCLLGPVAFVNRQLLDDFGHNTRTNCPAAFADREA